MVDPNQVGFVPLESDWEYLDGLGFLAAGSGWKYFDFPLTVDKTWAVDATGYWQGARARYQGDIRVRAYEDVETRAGTFKAFRIQREWIFTPQSGAEFRWGDVGWYAPEVKVYVKFSTQHPLVPSWELLSFRVK